MKRIDPIFAWKQAYWGAIEEGLAPPAATERANRRFRVEFATRPAKPRYAKRRADAHTAMA